MQESIEDAEVIELPDGWVRPDVTLAPLLDEENVTWLTIMNYVCTSLRDAGNDEDVLIAYRDQAVKSSFSRLVRISMAFMGEFELEHDSPIFV